MAEVIERSGASREAVRFYINAGLLPEPHRTARNMAWYSERHIEVIKLIRAMQEEQFLPLKAIKALFDGDEDFECTPRQRSIFASMREEMLGRLRRTPPGPASHAMAEALGLSDADYGDLQSVGAIRANADRLTADEEEIVRQFATLRHSGMTANRGFSAKHLEIVESAADVLFTQEIKLFQEFLVDLRDEEIPVLMSRVIPAVNRIFAVYHERRLRAFVARYAQNGSINGALDVVATTRRLKDITSQSSRTTDPERARRRQARRKK